MKMLIDHVINQLGLRKLPSAINGIVRKCSGVSAVFRLLISEQPIGNELSPLHVQSGLRNLPPGGTGSPDSITLHLTLSLQNPCHFILQSVLKIYSVNLISK